MDLIEELKKIACVLERNRIEYALCGGIAIAIYAKPRATIDIDIMIDPDVLLEAKKILATIGFEFASAPMEFHDDAIVIHRLVKIDAASGGYLELDLLLVTPETKSAWEQRVIVEWEGAPLQVISPDGLILLKSFRNSGQDQDDIAHLRKLENKCGYEPGSRHPSLKNGE